MKPTSHDMPKCYLVPREDTTSNLTLEEELDAASVLDPLRSDSQSSQPGALDSPGTEGPRTPPHYCDSTAVVLPFDLTWLGVLPGMSPVMEQENELLNLAPGSPVRREAPPGLSQNQNRLQRSSYSGSPKSIGSPAGTSSLAHALQVRTCPATPAIFSHQRETPTQDVEG